MILAQAKSIADAVVALLEPHCVPGRCVIAGSIRRECHNVGDIEVVCIPKPYETGLFASGIAPVVNGWEKVKGEMPCKYTQRMLPEGIKLDLFFAVPENWGLILAIRTGSAAFSHHVLASRWVKMGFRSVDGMLQRDGLPVAIREERSLFTALELAWVPPKKRSIYGGWKK